MKNHKIADKHPPEKAVFMNMCMLCFLVVTVNAAAVSLACYLLYYNLDSVRGYVDGMVPLLIIGVIMVVVTVSVMQS